MTGFDTNFEALTGHLPMGWQRRLYDEWFMAGEIPPALDLPTGLGKTSVMAIWSIARAAGAKLPRRLVYIVDRRAVVDQATAIAEQIRANSRHDLPISTLRGRFVDNRRWLEDPSATAIIIGTIDMIGSRLLFEGYGVSRGMRPYQAGILGSDALVVLDEAHLCPPFEWLLRTIRDDECLKSEPCLRDIVPPFRLLALSATGRDDMDGTFRLQGSELEEPVVRERVDARKRLALGDLASGARLEDVLANRALELGQDGQRILVFCNSRETARKVAERLEKQAADRVAVLVGARRVHEREALVGRLTALGFLPGSAADDARSSAFLVATSAGEVGIDLDADHLVCDLVEVERMIQRLGRVNRRGGTGREAIIDVVCAPRAKEKPDDATKRLAALRAPLATLPRGEDGRHDASPAALGALRSNHRDLVQAATTPEPMRPALDRAVVEAWSMTSLHDHPGRPAIAPWLRGWIDDDDPQTEVVWRRYLPWRRDALQPDRGEVEAFFEAAWPHTGEVLEAPAFDALEVLVKRAQNLGERHAGEPTLIVLGPAREFRRALTVGQLAAVTDRKTRDDLLGVLIGGTVVVVAALGGLDRNGLLDSSADGPPPCLDGGWSEDELAQAGLRILHGEQPVGDWREIHRLVLASGDDETADALIVARWRAADADQAGDLAVSRREQRLTEHSDTN